MTETNSNTNHETKTPFKPAHRFRIHETSITIADEVGEKKKRAARYWLIDERSIVWHEGKSVNIKLWQAGEGYLQENPNSAWAQLPAADYYEILPPESTVVRVEVYSNQIIEGHWKHIATYYCRTLTEAEYSIHLSPIGCEWRDMSGNAGLIVASLFGHVEYKLIP